VKIAKDIRYIDSQEGEYKQKPDNLDAHLSELKIKNKAFSFFNPYDENLKAMKAVFIHTQHLVDEHTRWNAPDFKAIKGVIENSSIMIDGVHYDQAILLGNYAIREIDTAILQEAAVKISSNDRPIKMLTHMYIKLFGGRSRYMVTICYAESIPIDIEWHTSSPITEERAEFIAAFKKRSKENMVIIE
jgi:hypothetical protein